MTEGMKTCPYCGGEIKQEAIKCRHCGKFLNGDAQEVSISLPLLLKILRIVGISVAVLGIIILLLWVFCGDYPAISRSSGDFWKYVSSLLSGILHAILAVMCGIVVLIIKK